MDPNLVVTLQFRDGERDVPGHLARMMSSIETYRLTYEQAVDEANRRQLGGYVTHAHEKFLRDSQRETT